MYYIVPHDYLSSILSSFKNWNFLFIVIPLNHQSDFKFNKNYFQREIKKNMITEQWNPISRTMQFVYNAIYLIVK